MSARLTVRFAPVYEQWIADLAGDQADAVRALMVLGAAALGLPGAQREALRLLESDFAADVESALLALADKRQTSGRQAADRTEAPPPAIELAEEREIDPFMAAGIEV